jgi:dsDNA-specific endonuclease/ATPase MutS2
MLLINDTKYDCLYTLALSLNGYVEEKFNGKILGETMVPVGELFYDELNDAPEVEIECWRITTLGTGNRLHKVVKVKAKQFFKSLKTAPILDKQVHLYRIFENLADSESPRYKKKTEDLKTYTKRSAATSPVKPGSNLQRLGHEVEALANFTTEIDIHIEKLVDSSSGMKNADIVRIQMAAFDNYMSQAIRLGVDRVFIIHGMGEGKLKNMIASRLIQTPEVVSFKNEFHPRYGYGATEVIFKEES